MGLKFCVKVVVFIVGIFFDGKIYIGLDNYSGGCVGDLLFILFFCCLCELLLCVGCLKIGILLCIDVWIIDFSVLV